MRRQGTPVSREALYEEVWTVAMMVVAPRYGLSDVGLVKICKKLGIPVPPPGYWAKIKAGRPTRKVPLPALPAGARGLTRPIPLSERHGTKPHRLAPARHRRRHRRPGRSEAREGGGRGAPPADLRGGAHPIRSAGCARATRNVASCAPCSATPACCSARTGCAGSSPRSRTEPTETASSHRRSSSGSSGPRPRRTGSIRACGAAIRSSMRRSRRRRVTGSTEFSPPDVALTFVRIVASGIKRRNGPRTGLQIDLKTGPA